MKKILMIIMISLFLISFASAISFSSERLYDSFDDGIYNQSKWKNVSVGIGVVNESSGDLSMSIQFPLSSQSDRTDSIEVNATTNMTSVQFRINITTLTMSITDLGPMANSLRWQLKSGNTVLADKNSSNLGASIYPTIYNDLDVGEWMLILNRTNLDNNQYDLYFNGNYLRSFFSLNGTLGFRGDYSKHGGGGGSNTAITSILRVNYTYEGFTGNPEVILNDPINNKFLINPSYVFNASVNPSLSSNNATIFIWYENGTIFNQTTNSLIGPLPNSTSWNISLSTGNFKWNVFACQSNSSDSFCNFAPSNFTFLNGFVVNNITYNSTTIETSNEGFILNFTTGNLFSSSTILNYNNTNYVANVSCNANNVCLASTNINIPLISGTQQNNSFYWIVNLFSGNSSFIATTPSNIQTVNQLSLVVCTSGSRVLNFTAYDEQNRTRISPFNFEATFDYRTSPSSSFSKNLTISNLTATEVNICINTNTTIYTDAIIAYSAPNNPTSYITRNYFYQNYPISNNTQRVPLYLLRTAASTSFILKVQDNFVLPIVNALVNVQRCYPGDNSNETVFISRTNANGLTVGNFEAETALYKFFITNNSQTMLAVDQCAKVVPTTAPFTLLFQVSNAYVSPFNINNITDLDATLVYNTTTNQVVLSYIDTSGVFNQSQLIVRSLNYSGSSQPIVCNVTSSLSSGILTCDMPSSGSYAASAFIYRSPGVLFDQITFAVQSVAGILSDYGIFLGFFIILISAFAFKYNELAGIWLINVAVIFCNYVGLIAFGKVFITAMLFISIIITGVLER